MDIIDGFTFTLDQIDSIIYDDNDYCSVKSRIHPGVVLKNKTMLQNEKSCTPGVTNLGEAPTSTTYRSSLPTSSPNMWYQKVTQAPAVGLRYLDDIREAISPACLGADVSI